MRLPALLGWVVLSILTASPAAQSGGAAEITSPSAGQAVVGVVTILGTANHPDFLGYDLAFAYAENPTDTWFALGDPVNTPVAAGRLGLWDTTAITDGEYSLRLRVWLSDGSALTAQVDGLRVRNRTPVEPSQAAATATRLATSSPALPLGATPAPPPARPSRARSALATGAGLSLLLLASLGAYTLAQSSFRPRWASFRSRLLQRKVERRERSWRARR